MNSCRNISELSKKRVAIILSRFPYPLDKGDKLRAYHQIRALSAHYSVYLFTLCDRIPDDQQLKALAPYCTEIHYVVLSVTQRLVQMALGFFRKDPAQVAYFFQYQAKQQFDAWIGQCQPHLIYGQLSRTARYLLPVMKPTMLDFQDCFSANYRRMARSKNGIVKWFYLREARRMQEFEGRMLQWFQHCTIISASDRKQIPGGDQIRIVPNGVDSTYFRPTKTDKLVDLVFVGNLSYEPNIHAAEFLVNEVMPLVWNQMPQVQLLLAGTTPSPRVRRLQEKRVQVSGWMPDIRQAYASGKVFVAPLFTGAGLQNKLLEAMSMQLPCITTPLVNESLNALPDQDLLIGNNAQEFTTCILELLAQPQRREELGEKARNFVVSAYNWESANAPLLECVQLLIN